MNKQLFTHYASTYGSEISQWPNEVKQVAVDALAVNPQWQSLLEAEVSLDQALDAYQVSSSPLPDLEQAILNSTAAKIDLIDRILAWLIPQNSVFRPALVACVPLLVGVILGNSLEIEDQYVLSEEIELISSFTVLEPDLENDSEASDEI